MLQEKLIIDYASQLIPEQTTDKREIRYRLLENLLRGAPFDLPNGSKIKFKLQVEPTETNELEVDGNSINILILDGDNQVASVKTVVYFDAPKESQELSKYYSEDAPQEIRGKGLISIATALLFQVLIENGVEEVWGKIDGGLSNIASIRTRLNTPDVIGGGFFATEYRVVSLGNGSYELYLITHLDKTTEAVFEDEFLEKLRKVAYPFLQ